jgi:hypothetical protein
MVMTKARTDFDSVEEAMPDAKRFCARDGISWIMRNPVDGLYHVVYPYSEGVKHHYLHNNKWELCVELHTEVRAKFHVKVKSQAFIPDPEAMFVALRNVKVRLHFIGMPGESMFNAGTEEAPLWISDWRETIDLLEHALHGSERKREAKPTDTVRRCQVMTSSRTMLSTLKAILAVAERYDTPEMNTIRDSARHALPRPQL